MQSEAVARALRIEDEPQKVRERYGMYPDKAPAGKRRVRR